VASALVASGTAPKHAKALSFLVHKELKSEEPAAGSNQRFNESMVGIWTDDCVELDQMNEVATVLADAVASKMVNVDEAMKAHATWKGALSRMDVDLTVHNLSITAGLEFLDDGGGRPSLITARRNCLRGGPSGFPLTGAGCHIQPVGEVGVIVVVLKVQAVLMQGLVLRDIRKYLETDAGAAQLNSEDGRVFCVPKGGTAYIPWGWVAEVLYYSPKPDKSDPDWAHILHVPLFKKSSAETLSKETLRAIYNYNMDHLISEKAQMWKDRARVWEKFMKPLIDA
jgi:hypothetical protein